MSLLRLGGETMFGHNDDNQYQDTPAQSSEPVSDTPVNTTAPVSDDTPASGAPLPPPEAEEHDEGSDTDVLTPKPSDDLVSIKREALEHLTPLVEHLDQTPEEKFRTLMMMIQASDDQTKLKEAFTSAKEISDDKTRAQALLDVINEINYFTQHA